MSCEDASDNASHKRKNRAAPEDDRLDHRGDPTTERSRSRPEDRSEVNSDEEEKK